VVLGTIILIVDVKSTDIGKEKFYSFIEADNLIRNVDTKPQIPLREVNEERIRQRLCKMQ